MSKKAAAFIAIDQSHYIDHLAVIVSIMDIPFIVLTQDAFDSIKQFYPNIKAELQNETDITRERLISDYDVLFLSDLWSKETFLKHFSSLEKSFHKQLRRVVCPHGYSDKTFYFKAFAGEDLCLVYGQQMIDFFAKYNITETLSGIIRTGNHRYLYYRLNQSFYDKLAEELIFSGFKKKQPLIIYAPTWQDLTDSTTFFSAFMYILEKLPPEYNMLIKLHPLLELTDPASYYYILGLYEKQPNVVFTKDFLPVYPLLAKADLYLGDMSSVGYDFLTFNKPMFFLNKTPGNQQPYLFQCGTEIPNDRFKDLYSIINDNFAKDQTQLSQKRKEVYEYTFGQERSFEEIKSDILKSYDLPRWKGEVIPNG